MRNRQTVKPFDAPDMEYTTLYEDKNKEDRYMVEGRNKITEKIVRIIGKQAEVEKKIGKPLFEVITTDHVTDNEGELTATE